MRNDTKPTPTGVKTIAARAADEARAFLAKLDKPAKPATDYYTLLTREDRASPWQIAFGDYSRADAMAERADLLEHDHRRINTTVIRTAPDQASIDRAVACLNAARKA
jgi:hypothetical protein